MEKELIEHESIDVFADNYGNSYYTTRDLFPLAVGPMPRASEAEIVLFARGDLELMAAWPGSHIGYHDVYDSALCRVVGVRVGEQGALSFGF